MVDDGARRDRGRGTGRAKKPLPHFYRDRKVRSCNKREPESVPDGYPEPESDVDPERAFEHWQREAFFVANQFEPLIEFARPIVGAAHDDFLNDRQRWADDIIKAVEREADIPGAVRLFDSERFVKTRLEAMLRLAWLMAYYFPKDNPLLEAQGKRAKAIGFLDGWDGKTPLKTEEIDLVIWELGIWIKRLDEIRSEGDGPGMVFPREIGLERAIAELKRWFKLATGRVFVEPEPAGDTEEEETETEVVSSNDERDAWLYDRDCAGVAASEIEREFKIMAKQKGWSLLTGWRSIRAATARYANRKNLPCPPSRQQKQRSAR